ncbi:MAG: DUF374 domain-containing protein [Planctomycetota bacterium]|nr:DUF374 domain-containing protein [Planctomycetota bacterium]
MDSSAVSHYPIAGKTLSILIRSFFSSMDLRWWGGERAVRALQQHGNLVITFWHEWVLPLSYTLDSNGFAAITSQHHDGARLGAALSHLDVKIVHGSSSRGGIVGFQKLEALARRGFSPVISVDGPKGPPRQAKQGAAALARRLQIPIMPLAFATEQSVRLNTWDRMIVPAAWGKSVVVAAEPILPARDRQGDRQTTQQLQDSLNEATELACNQLSQLWREGTGTSPVGESGLILAGR